MLETYSRIDLDFEVSDTTVSVFPGTARIGNKTLPYRGGRIQFSNMVDFGVDTSKYQYSSLFLQEFGGTADLTSTVSSTADSTMELIVPDLPSDSSNPYAPVHPLGLFAFYSPDGTDVDLISYSKVV